MTPGTIIKISARQIVVPLDRPVWLRGYAVREREYCLLEIATTDGHQGHALGFTRGADLAEPIVGYCRAIRIGDVVEVSGTTAMQNGEVVGVGDPYKQTIHILETIKRALEELEVGLEDVMRTRTYVTDISQWEAVGRAHGEYFKDILPVSSMVEVKGLINPELLVEIEAHAIASH